MLSDHEWKTLREVERRILTEDPEFARSFESSAHSLRREHLDGVGLTIFLVSGLLLSALLLVIGSLGGAVAFAITTGLIWWAWHHSVTTGQQAP